MAEQDCARMEEECEKKETTELIVGTTYLVASPLDTMVINSKCDCLSKNLHSSYQN